MSRLLLLLHPRPEASPNPTTTVAQVDPTQTSLDTATFARLMDTTSTTARIPGAFWTRSRRIKSPASPPLTILGKPLFTPTNQLPVRAVPLQQPSDSPPTPTTRTENSPTIPVPRSMWLQGTRWHPFQSLLTRSRRGMPTWILGVQCP